MKDHIILQGKSYISAKRASTISDYTSDYVGQLCRAKKLDCVRIGHAWFVHDESLLSHKAKVTQDLETEKVRYTQVAENQISNNAVLSTYREQGAFLPPLKKSLVKISAVAAMSVHAQNINAAASATPMLVKIPSFFPLVKSALMTAGVFGVLLIMIVSSLFVLNKTPRIVAVGSSTAGVYDALQTMTVFFQNKYLALRNLLNRDQQLPINMASAEQTSQYNAMAVVPSTGNESEDELMKQQIQRNFSDTVEVKPDASGTGGVITPVFKSTKGDDFMYVLVPIKENFSP
ncbi:MAG: hypothetical protein M3Q80_01360 [bacterium]|nr:hypothetical protein [bacterium]